MPGPNLQWIQGGRAVLAERATPFLVFAPPVFWNRSAPTRHRWFGRGRFSESILTDSGPSWLRPGRSGWFPAVFRGEWPYRTRPAAVSGTCRESFAWRRKKVPALLRLVSAVAGGPSARSFEAEGAIRSEDTVGR